jgi:hypothetical protein
VSRSHLSARHLLRQVEFDRSKRTKRDIRPEWLTALVESAAELFEPMSDVGRVGFDCRLDEQGWSAALYLGAVELVGGKSDGQTEGVGFHFDLKALLEQFSRIDDLSWTVVGKAEEGQNPPPSSFLLIDGAIGENRVRLTIHAAAPPSVGSGLRRLADGRFEPI